MSCQSSMRWIAMLAAPGLLAACVGGPKAEPEAVLRTEDFIADPATMPTALPAAPTAAAGGTAAQAAAPAPIDPRQSLDVVVEAGPPALAPLGSTEAVEPPALIDAKIGEINGRAIRVGEMFEDIGPQLATKARTRTLSPSEWVFIGRTPPRNEQPAGRDDWLALAEVLFRGKLTLILQDEILAAEARATLRPEQRMGLRAFVQESQDIKRRSAGGSRAELERQLRDENQNEQRFGRDIEAQLLINMQLEEKVRNRYKASWRDVKRFYARNIDAYQPPARARFRIIVVPADDVDGVRAIQTALNSGRPFPEVAALPANRFNPDGGGLFGEGAVAITGPYEEAAPFAFDELNEAAQKLSPGQFTAQPVTRRDRADLEINTWLFLESLETGGRSLADPDIQLSIVDRLNAEVREAGRTEYIMRLVKRATFTDIDEMTKTLVDIAAERFWPPGK